MSRWGQVNTTDECRRRRSGALTASWCPHRGNACSDADNNFRNISSLNYQNELTVLGSQLLRSVHLVRADRERLAPYDSQTGTPVGCPYSQCEQKRLQILSSNIFKLYLLKPEMI